MAAGKPDSGVDNPRLLVDCLGRPQNSNGSASLNAHNADARALDPADGIVAGSAYLRLYR
jgi:hypothetical protein